MGREISSSNKNSVFDNRNGRNRSVAFREERWRRIVGDGVAVGRFQVPAAEKP